MNPWNTERICGGSSGGDAGLVATKCVPISLATDIGGSIRVPAVYNGIFGFKTSTGRVSSAGNIYDFIPTLEYNKSARGPLATSVDDVKLMLQVLFHP